MTFVNEDVLNATFDEQVAEARSVEQSLGEFAEALFAVIREHQAVPVPGGTNFTETALRILVRLQARQEVARHSGKPPCLDCFAGELKDIAGHYADACGVPLENFSFQFGDVSALASVH